MLYFFLKDISSKGPSRPDENNILQEKVMHVLYTNADCLHNKLSELILLIESLKHKPNIIAITEFKDKCNKDVFIQEFSSSGYLLYCNDISSLSRGVLYILIVILSHQKFPFTHYLKSISLLKLKVPMVYI